MTNHTGRAALEHSGLHAIAEDFDGLHADIGVPAAPRDLPDVATASMHLATLTRLVEDLSDEVLFRAVDDDPELDLRLVVHGYTSAAAPALARNRG
ncbi:hypothetical protein IPZ61_04630 [Streptomyces sioyaensis]|uniref:hypothetical protein n=1 Tax=Streptomyces sioyaensis TaxID=67364 RepID=UPI001F22C0F7|nr:hypothetical protein [Streptomyces sioyaensis]MCF3172602.1 hypothetical protein [Streptomyces sioyaensis]